MKGAVITLSPSVLALLFSLIVSPIAPSWPGAQEQTAPAVTYLSPDEKEMIDDACNADRQLHGSDGYYACVSSQIAALRNSPGKPDLYHVSAQERNMIDDACKVDRLLHGPVKYYACVSSQVAALRNSPGKPDLSHVSARQKAMIADACDADRMLHGPAKYYACVSNQLAALGVPIARSKQPSPAKNPGEVLVKPGAPLDQQGATISTTPAVPPITQLPAQPHNEKPAWESSVLKVIGFLFLLCLLWLAYIKLIGERCPVCGARKSSAARMCNSCQLQANAKQTRAPSAQQQPNSGQDGSGEGRDSSFNPYEVLGVSQGASKDQIRSAYVDLMARYHPDKVAHLGLEFQAIAKEKTLAINRAYHLLTRP